MTLQYVLSPIAEQDIDEIITYLAKENPKAAHHFLESLFEAVEKLTDHPDMGHSREDLTDKPVKFWSFKWHYLIIYKPSAPLEVIRVLSGFRDVMNLMDSGFSMRKTNEREIKKYQEQFEES